MNQDSNNFNQNTDNNNNMNNQSMDNNNIYQHPIYVQDPVQYQPQYQQQLIQNNVQPANFSKKKYNKVLIIVFALSALIAALIVGLILKSSNKVNNDLNNSEAGVNANTNKEFDDDVILNYVTVRGVKLSEINTLQDALDKLNAKISFVSVCYSATEVEEGCSVYSYEKFLSSSVSKEGISSVDFVVTTDDEQLMLTFSASYKLFEREKTNVQYFKLLIQDSDYNVKLDGQTLYKDSYNEIKSRFNLDSTSNEYSYNIKFKSKDGDDYDYMYSGFSNSTYIYIFNTSQRDRGL